MTGPKEARERQELMPCPFCGKPGEYCSIHHCASDRGFECHHCGMTTQFYDAEKWNDAYCWKENAALEAENAELREALKEATDGLESISRGRDGCEGYYCAEVADIRLAKIAAALAPKQEGKTEAGS